MSDRPILLLLKDIDDACSRIEQYVTGISYDDFIQNTMMKDAVERNIEIIGEACNKLSADFLTKHSEAEWHKAIGMRNRLIHGYFSVDLPLLWTTATTIVPGFKQQIEKLIERYSSPS